MRQTILTTLLIIAAALSSCTVKDAPVAESFAESAAEPMTLSVQTKDQLPLEDAVETGAKVYMPLNYTDQKGMWFPYMNYGEYMFGKSEAEFREAVAQKYSDAKANGINTIYVHVHPCGDAYYRSELFPKGIYLDGDYDPLAIMLEEGHRLSLSVHAWINPLRAQTAEQMNEVDERFCIKALAKTNVNGRLYLNPSSDEALSLVNDCVTEIVENYDVDGIHIDDYFYPTTDPSIDAEQFAASGSTDLSAYRLERCSKMVHGIYEAVKRSDDRVLFGISPQGNIRTDYNSQYADVRLWGSCIGYCDYIVPQIYFGFQNETCPFAETLAEWQQLVTCSRVSLVIGLAAYKQGAEDRWAGAAGELEWAEDETVLARQIELVNGSENVHGYALYY